MTSVIDRLVAHGFAERRDDPTDRRRVIVALTPAGQAVVEGIQQGRRARLQRAIESIDPARWPAWSPASRRSARPATR